MIRIAVCLTLCAIFLCGFGYMIHLTNLAVAADHAVKAVMPEFSTRWDWLAYLGCCSPLGFALIWGARAAEAISKSRRES
jgi:hypothetical protein